MNMRLASEILLKNSLAEMNPPSPDLLRQLLRYEPETGKLFWRERPVEMFKSERDCSAWNTKYAGEEAFTAVDGYRRGCILGKPYLAHRVIWALHYGRWPENQIDHIDGERTNNRLSNLRDVSVSTNQRNAKMQRRNTSGVSGVCWHNASKKWIAYIRADGRNIHLGVFADINDAVAARKAAQAGLGYTERHGTQRIGGAT